MNESQWIDVIRGWISKLLLRLLIKETKFWPKEAGEYFIWIESHNGRKFITRWELGEFHNSEWYNNCRNKCKPIYWMRSLPPPHQNRLKEGSEMDTNAVYEVVKKLIGPINPVGESHTDDKRYENLKVMIALTDQLLTDIDAVAYENKDRQEASMKKAAELASEFYTRIGIVE